VADASLDWGQFRIDVLGIAGHPDPTWSFIDRSAALSTSATTIGDSNDTHTRTVFNWTSPTTVQSITPEAEATASASGQGLHARGVSTALSSGDFPFQQNATTARAARTAILHVDGPAAVVFSAPFVLETSGPPFDFDDYATANVTGNASFQSDFDLSFQNASRTFSLDSRSGPVPPLPAALIFGLIIDTAGIVTTTLEVNAASFSHDVVEPTMAVPEPSALLQMLAGLLAIGGIAVRRSLLHSPA